MYLHTSIILQTEREFYAMREGAQKAKDEMASMNTYKMDMALHHFSTFLHHDDLVSKKTCSLRTLKDFIENSVFSCLPNKKALLQ